MITIDGVEYPSHKEYFEKYPWKRKQFEIANKKLYIAFKSKPCIDCGLAWHPVAMTLDHTDRNGYKTHNNNRIYPSNMTSYPTELFKSELIKCEPVCMNCHALREWYRDKRHLREHGYNILGKEYNGALECVTPVARNSSK